MESPTQRIINYTPRALFVPSQYLSSANTYSTGLHGYGGVMEVERGKGVGEKEKRARAGEGEGKGSKEWQRRERGLDEASGCSRLMVLLLTCMAAVRYTGLGHCAAVDLGEA